MRGRRGYLQVTYNLGLMAMVVSLPLQMMWIHEHPLSEIGLALLKLNWVNWLVVLSCLTTMGLSLTRSPYWLASALISVVVVGLNNLIVGLAGTDFSMWQATLATLVFGGFVMFPRFIRMYESRVNDRSVFIRPVLMVVGGGDVYQSVGFDISQSGIFIQTKEADFWGLRLGDHIDLQWESPQNQPVYRQATVVRVAEARGKYPRGLGLKFDRPTSSSAFL